MSRAKSEHFEAIQYHSSAAEYERALDSSLAEQYPNYCCINAKADNLLERAERLGRELDEFNDNLKKKAA